MSWWIADPAGTIPSAPLVVPLGVVTLLLAGLPFRLSQQYWRFAGMGDLLHRALGEIVELETVSTAGLWKVEADPATPARSTATADEASTSTSAAIS